MVNSLLKPSDDVRRGKWRGVGGVLTSIRAEIFGNDVSHQPIPGLQLASIRLLYRYQVSAVQESDKCGWHLCRPLFVPVMIYRR